RTLRRQRVVATDQQPQRLLEDWALLESRQPDADGDERHVGTVASDRLEAPLRGVGRLEVKRHVGVTPAELDDGLAEEVSHCRPTGGDRDPAGLAAAQAEDLAPRQRQRAQPRAAGVVEELTGSRECEAGRPPPETRRTAAPP